MKRVKAASTKIRDYIRLYHQHTLSAFLILLTISIVYWSDFEILANEALQSEAASHIILVPFLAGFLLYRRKDLVKATLAFRNSQKKAGFKYLDEVVGSALCLIAFLLYWYGSYTFYPLEYHLLSLPIFISGTTLVLFGLKTVLALAFPILFLLFLIPPPIEIMYTIGGTMGNFNTEVSYTLLNAIGLPVALESAYGPPTIAVTGSSGQPMYFGIDLPCSGIYSLIAFLMFAAFLINIVKAPTFKKAGIFVLGFAVFGALNIIRITTIVSVGYSFGEEVAMLIFHSMTGWLLILAGMFLILIVAEKFWKIQITSPKETQKTCFKCKTSRSNLQDFCSNCGRLLGSVHSKLSRNFWSKLLLILLCSYLVTLSIQAPTFVIAQESIEITSTPNGQNATTILPQVPDYYLKFLYRDRNYEKIARQDASLLYAYYPNNISNPRIYAEVGIASTISNLHSWEVCLITWQINRGHDPLVTVLDSREIRLLEDVPIIARYLVFESPSAYTQYTLYWYERATINTGITVEQKYVRISLIIFTQNNTNNQNLETQLLPVAQSIASYWEPLKSQSLISIGIPMQQSLLVLAIAFVAVAKTTEYTASWNRKNRNLRIFNNYASQNEKLVLQTIQDLFKKAKFVRTKQIRSALKSKTKTLMQHETLHDILKKLEKYELIKRDIMNVDANPVVAWKL